MKEITLKIRINEDAHETELRRVGCKVPDYWIQSDSADAVASAWRALAAYALENAFLVEHSKDFCAPLFTNAEREEMARRVCEEYKNLLDPSEDCA